MRPLSALKRLFPWLAPKPRTFALVGKSGTGKSFKARQVARRPADRAWLRACTCQIVIGDFAAAAAPPASAAEAGSAAALILAREDAGILEAAEAEPVAKAVAAVIGEGKLGQLRQVWREAHRTRDDDARGTEARPRTRGPMAR